MDEFNISGLVDKVFPIVCIAVFALTALVVLTIIINGLIHWHVYFQSPKLTEMALVVGKRADVSCDHSWTDANGKDGRFHTYSTYYATFQMESGDRVELELSGTAYGLLVEGDMGELTYKGSRFLEFDRNGPGVLVKDETAEEIKEETREEIKEEKEA